MRRLALALLVGFCLVRSSAAANLVYNFDTPGSESNNGGHGDGLNPEGWVATIGANRDSFTIPGGRTAVTPGDQDSQNQNMVFSSPAFFLSAAGGGIVSVDLAGGQGNGPGPVDPANLPANLSSISPGPSGTDPTNVLVLGLRNVSSGNYVSFLQKSSVGDTWSNYTWDLSAFANGTTAYQIDQIDTRFGGWGHIEIDNVSIPGTLVPEPASVVLFGVGLVGLLVAARRRR